MPWSLAAIWVLCILQSKSDILSRKVVGQRYRSVSIYPFMEVNVISQMECPRHSIRSHLPLLDYSWLQRTPFIIIEEAIKRTGCDAVFVIALLDVMAIETYQPGRAYYPMSYGMYGSYYGYYNHYYPMVYSPGYYTTDKTYYIETNFYDLESDQLLWSIQSEAYNPSSLDSWFDRYSYDLLRELEREGLLKR